MQPFPISQLIWPAIAILVLGFLLSLTFTRRAGLSLFVAALKSGLFLVYFGFFFDGTYTFLDDWKYLRFGKELVQNGVGIFNLVHNYDYVRSTVKSANLFYYVYNASALVIFGQGYFAPVAMNVILTFIAAGLLMKAARVGLGMSRRSSIGLFVFLALSPSLIHVFWKSDEGLDAPVNPRSLVRTQVGEPTKSMTYANKASCALGQT